MGTLRIGIDDTDSRVGMCTTYLAYRIVGDLRSRGEEIPEYPKLVRLNPNIPWRTRGNGAVGITVRTADPQGTKKRIESMVRKYADTANGANPGLVFLESDKIPADLRKFAREALWRVIPRSRARRMAKDARLDCRWIGNGQGLVGAISAIGYEFVDSTMELLAYRSSSKIGRPRDISAKSVKDMHERTFPSTFNSYDAAAQRVLIAPHGADPVLYGIRGEDAGALIAASRIIRSETPAGHMIFVSNQGTGDHLANMLDPAALRAHESGMIEGKLCEDAHIVGSGHVRLAVSSRGAQVDCYVYHKTGMGALARSLVRGDKVRIGGGVRRARAGRRSLNAETIRVSSLAPIVRSENPVCGSCAKHMKSKGTGQGFECARCGKKAVSKVRVAMRRTAHTGLYVTRPLAQRHLARPAHRTPRTSPRMMRPRTALWIR